MALQKTCPVSKLTSVHRISDTANGHTSMNRDKKHYNVLHLQGIRNAQPQQHSNKPTRNPTIPSPHEPPIQTTPPHPELNPAFPKSCTGVHFPSFFH